MKKILSILIAILIVMSLTACNNVAKINVISETQLTDRENNLLSVGNSKYFVYDFKVDDSYEWAKIWVDRYEFGEKVSGNSGMKASLNSNQEGMIVVTVNEYEITKSNWTMTLITDTVTSTGNSIQEPKIDGVFSTIWRSNNLNNAPINESEIILGSISYQNKDSLMISFTNEFYNNPEENIAQIENHDIVYLLKVKFYKNNPEINEVN